MVNGLDGLAPRDLVVLCDCSLQIIVFLAGNEANSLQCREVLFGFDEVALHQVCFAEVLRCRGLSVSACS
jgi:hypothetical protein